MQLEELALQWRLLDQKLDRSLTLCTELAKQVVLQPARRRVNHLAVWPMIDIIFCVFLIFLGVTILSSHFSETQLLVSTCVVILGALALLVSSIRQLHRIAELDWSGPVAHIQCSLQRLKAMKIEQFKWVILFSPLVGFCGLVAGLHCLFEWLTDGRVGILNKLDPWWITANYLFGILFVPLGYYLARVFAERCHHHHWWQTILDDISGNSLKDVTAEVNRWAEWQEGSAS